MDYAQINLLGIGVSAYRLIDAAMDRRSLQRYVEDDSASHKQ